MKFHRIMNKIFSILFGAIAITEIIGVMTGRWWCIYPAIICGIVSVVMWRNARKFKFRRR